MLQVTSQHYTSKLFSTTFIIMEQTEFTFYQCLSLTFRNFTIFWQIKSFVTCFFIVLC